MTEGFMRKPEFQESGFCPVCGWEKDHPDREDVECFHCCGAVKAQRIPPPKKGGEKPPPKGGGGKKMRNKSPHNDAARIAANKAREVRDIQRLRFLGNQPTPRWHR